jgi:hypothetical protein
MRPHRIAIPYRLVKLMAQFYDVSHAQALTTIRSARGDGLHPGTDLQDMHLQLISAVWRYRFIVTGRYPLAPRR